MSPSRVVQKGSLRKGGDQIDELCACLEQSRCGILSITTKLLAFPDKYRFVSACLIGSPKGLFRKVCVDKWSLEMLGSKMLNSSQKPACIKDSHQGAESGFLLPSKSSFDLPTEKMPNNHSATSRMLQLDQIWTCVFGLMIVALDLCFAHQETHV